MWVLQTHPMATAFALEIGQGCKLESRMLATAAVRSVLWKTHTNAALYLRSTNTIFRQPLCQGCHLRSAFYLAIIDDGAGTMQIEVCVEGGKGRRKGR